MYRFTYPVIWRYIERLDNCPSVTITSVTANAGRYVFGIVYSITCQCIHDNLRRCV